MKPADSVPYGVKRILLPQIARSDARACSICAQHAALYRYGNQVRRDRDHDLCFRCYRSLFERLRAATLRRAA